MAKSKSRKLADFISDSAIDTAELADSSITPAKLDSTGSYTVADLTVSSSYPDLVIEDSDGTNQSLTIQQVGGASMIKPRSGSNDGELYVTGAVSGNNILKTTTSGAVQLYHNNSPKLDTTSTGVDVTGLITTDIGSVGGSDQVLAEFKAEDTRKVGVFWDDSESTLGIGTITNHPLVFHANGNSNKKMVLDQSGRVRFAGTGSYNSILYGTGGEGFNEIFVSGYSAPNVAFEYDFNKSSYANIFEITCGISHWSSSYYSYKKCIVHTLNNAVYERNNQEANGGNGSWTISAPASGTLRVRMNGDASYSYASGWFIKISGVLRNSNP